MAVSKKRKEFSVVREVRQALAHSGLVRFVEPTAGVKSGTNQKVTAYWYAEISQRLDPPGRVLVMLERANTGGATLPAGKGRFRTVRFGNAGQGDFCGVIAPYGTHVEIEVKRPDMGSDLTDAQLQRALMLCKMGAIYLVVRDGPDAVRQLKDALEQLAERHDVLGLRAEGTTG